MMRPNPYLLLLSTLDFSVADLVFNRQGQLSPGQRLALERERLQQIERCLLTWVALFIAALVLRVHWFVIVLGTSAMGWMLAALWLRCEEDLRVTVQRVSGHVEGHQSVAWLFYNRFCLSVNQQTLMVSARINAAFEPGRCYRLYYTSGSRRLLSAEVMA